MARPSLLIAASARPAWQSHKQKWIGCTACPAHEHALCRVLARGRIPCEVLFIGEAPGESEDATGRPFAGRAGKVMDQLILDSELAVRTYDYAITNVVACKPFPAGAEIAKPTKESIEACRPRLRVFIDNIACPDLIVTLGRVAEKAVLPLQKGSTVPAEKWFQLQHPSYILRNGGTNSLEYKRNILTLNRILKTNLPK